MGREIIAFQMTLDKLLKVLPALCQHEMNEQLNLRTDLIFQRYLPGWKYLFFDRYRNYLYKTSVLSVRSSKGGKTNELAGGEVERGTWGSPLEFTLACIGYAVGLGNVWRFPHLVFRNGGGAFLVPYMIMAFAVGIPIFLAELFVGQYSGFGAIKAYAHLAPFFSGLGVCCLVVITFVTIYYMIIIAWIIFYFVASFFPRLGWGYCDHEWNTADCYSSIEDLNCKQNNTGNSTDMIFWRLNCTEVGSICQQQLHGVLNGTHCWNLVSETATPIRKVINRTLASEEYYYQNVLGINGATWENFGWPRWQLVVCLAVAWIIAFFCLSRGIKSAGKVVYFTALFPYVMLTAILIRGVTLPGAGTGIAFYIQPEWESLLDASVWGDAASQIFYSFGLASNSLVSFASYCKFKNNCHFDAVLVSLTNAFTAVFAGFAVFSVMGFMAHNLDVEVGDVVKSGPGLAFIAYPEAVLMMPLPHLWAVSFFFMMFVLGMGSQFGGIEALCTAVIDQWPHLRNHHWKVTAGVCMACFIAGLPMVCNGGVYLFTLLDWHTASWAVLLLGMAEVVVLSWVYGMGRTLDNLADMTMRFTGIIRVYWSASWMIVTPITCLALFIFIMTDIGPTNFAETYVFPKWADTLGWMLGSCTLLPFVIGVLYQVLVKRTKLNELFKPSPNWRSQEEASQLAHDIKSYSAAQKVTAANGVDNVAFVNEPIR